MYNPKASIYISLGTGQDIGIDENDHLFIRDYTNYAIDLGLATKHRFKSLTEYVERLQIHAVEEGVL